MSFTGPSIGEPLIGQAARERAVANQGRHFIVFAQKIPGLGHTHRHRHGIGGVTGNKRVVNALRRLGKTGNAPKLPDAPHCVFPASEHFVDVTLVPHIKHQAVPTGIQHLMDCHRQLHHPQVGRQMAPGFGDRGHQLLPQLGAQRIALTGG